MSLRPCIACGELITHGSRCDACKPSRQVNGWRWTQQRAAHLAAHPCCVVCGRHDNLEVHHVVALRDGGTDHPSNLETRCATHHRDVTY